MTMRHRILWRVETGTTDVLLNDGMGEPFVVSVTPVVTADALAVRVGVLHRGHDSFGYWTADRSTDPVTAWRTARVLTRVSELNVRGMNNRNDITAVLQLFSRNLDPKGKDFQKASDVLRMTPDALEGLVSELMGERPDGRTMFHLMNGLTPRLQEEHLNLLALYVERYPTEVTDRLRRLFETIELQVRTKAEQIALEDALIAAGIADDASLESFLATMNVRNLLHTEPGDFGPSHFGQSPEHRSLDQEVLGQLIGRSGFSHEVRLLTTDMQPDDPKAHQAVGGGGLTVYTSNYGSEAPPRVMIGTVAVELMAVRWDRVTERYLLRVRPAGIDRDDTSKDEWRSLAELRELATPVATPGILRRVFGSRSSR